MDMGPLPLIHINLVNLLLTIVVFATVLLLLAWKAWTPILKALDDRDHKIREDLDEAENARQENKKLLAEQQKVMSELREEARHIREEARSASAKEGEAIMKQARAEAQKIMEKAQLDLNAEKRAAIEELKNVAVNVGLDLARQLIRRELRKEDHVEVINQSLVELDQAYQQAG